MSHIAVVYWSGTGHTEAMAQKVAEGIISAGGEATVLTASEFNGSMMDSYDAVAFGCPSMGAEQLEESEFEPMFQEYIQTERQKNRPLRLLRMGRR